jgi:hypothetical protein
MKVQPYHTITPEAGQPGHRGDVYHDQSTCSDGMRIKPENRRAGSAGRLKCDECKNIG